MIPEFMQLSRPKFVERGKIIRVKEEKDIENIEATKAKKLKQVHEFLTGIKQSEFRYYYKEQGMLEMMNAKNDWMKVFDKKKDQRGFMDSMDDETKLSIAKEKSFIQLQTQIPTVRKDMTDLKKDRRK